MRDSSTFTQKSNSMKCKFRKVDDETFVTRFFLN